jgi:hypothetical protein
MKPPTKIPLNIRVENHKKHTREHNYPAEILSSANTRYEVLCSIAILLDKPQPIYTYTDAKYAIRKEGKPAGSPGSVNRQRKAE